MQKLLTLTFLFCGVFAFAQNRPSATDQMHNAMTQSLANTEYYDEAHRNVPNAHGVATRDNLTGEAELLRQGIGAPFVENKGGKYSKGASPTKVKNYIAHSTADPNHEIVMPSTVEIPPVSAPVSISEDEADDMFLDALGGGSSAGSYHGNYETAVGKQREQNFDMSETLSDAAEKQNRANEQFANDVAVARQRQAAADKQYAAQNANNNRESEEPGFWGKLGKIALQGMVNVGIEATNYKYGTNIETIGNKNSSNSSGSANQSCTYEGQRFYGQTCQSCINNKPRSSSSCSQCCNSLGRSIYRAVYPHRWSGDGRNYCFCMFNSSGTKGYLF